MKELVGFKKGINIGGWYSQCVYSEQHYLEFIKKDEFRRISKMGFDHVRIPFDYNLIQNLDGTFIEEGFVHLQNAIDWCKENHLNIILDLHKTIGYSFDRGEKEDGFFGSEKYQGYFYSLWEEMAKRFAKNENVAFELLNEVTEYEYQEQWNKIIKEVVSRIRKICKTVPILYGGYYYNSIEAIKDLQWPADENIYYVFHCYSPIVFTHQGAYWVDKMPLDFRMHFDENTNKYIEYMKQNVGTLSSDKFKPDSYIDETYFEDMWAEAIKICEERKVGLLCTEYGVIDAADPEDIVKWYRCIHKAMKKYNIGSDLWVYKEMNFGFVDAHYDDIREELLKIIKD